MSGGAPTISARTAPNLLREVPLRELGGGARVRWSALATVILWIASISALLATVSIVWPIPPLVESDYTYLLTAADRLVDGNGLTTTPPLAPHQSWQWQGDWTYLTRWPVGYSLIVAGLRMAFGVTSIEACGWISVVACAMALVGWFTWSMRLIPSGFTRYLFASACAGLSLPVAWLVNPSTDLIIVAALPWLMIAVVRVVLNLRESAQAKACGSANRRGLHFADRSGGGGGSQQMISLAMIGLATGSLIWIRYASVFVPLAIGAHLISERVMWPGVRWRHILAFAAGSTLPIAALLAVNFVLGTGESTRSQLNLGDQIGLDFSLSMVGRAWWMFTDLGYYAHRAIAHWMFAFLPVVMLVGAITIRRVRRSAMRFLATPAVSLSIMVVLSLLAMLIVTKALFSDKFDYIGLARYYQPIKPLYLALVIAPIIAYRRKWFRAGACVGLVLACSWTLQQDWVRTYARWSHAERATTPLGSWSRCFEPGAGELFDWVAAYSSESSVVASNFHEFVAFETGIPAIPTPPNLETLDKWVAQIRKMRNVDTVRVIFALDPSNKWRDNWLDSPAEVVERFGLRPLPNTPATIARYLFELPKQVVSASAHHGQP